MFTRMLLMAVWLALSAYPVSGYAAETALVTVAYIAKKVERKPVLSNLDPVPEDEGIAGAKLAIEDNKTTGKFLGHVYRLTLKTVESGGDAAGAARQLLHDGVRLLIVDAPETDLLAIADLPEAADALIFNVRSEATLLRGAECRANVLHSVPSLAMRADALAQYAVLRKFKKWALLSGKRPRDLAFAEALTASARKFGITMVGSKQWSGEGDLRRSASREVPRLTQDFGDYDLLVVADENDDFARYIPYNTWLPRPVAGSEGLTPVAWSPVVESWGAAQLQSRFKALNGRPMRAFDYAAWLAVRTIGEAVTRTGKADAATLRAYILSDDFEIAAFKGRKVTYRKWNGQARQPIPLVDPRAVVASAPLPGFLHRRTELDTLGLDEPESGCTAFK